MSNRCGAEATIDDTGASESAGRTKMIEWLNRIHQGSALDVLRQMPSDSVDCIMTSPPYWALRSYQTEPQIWNENNKCRHYFTLLNTNHDNRRYRASKYTTVGNNLNKEIYPEENTNDSVCKNCSAWRGELGLEPTFNLYIDHLLLIFAEVKRVMKPAGTLWVNLGDTYAGSGNGTNNYRTNESKSISEKLFDYNQMFQGKQKRFNSPSKSLCGIPERFAIRMTDELDFIRRNTIIWYKRNAMPSSVKDRFTIDFESIYFFVKSKRYYFNQQFEPHQWADRDRRSKRHWSENKTKSGKMIEQRYSMGQVSYGKEGRNMRCVWDIPTQPFLGAHFATYPERLCETVIKAGCPESGIVLDPFSGAATTCLVAKKLNRNFIGIELSKKYVEIAERRIEQECGTLI